MGFKNIIGRLFHWNRGNGYINVTNGSVNWLSTSLDVKGFMHDFRIQSKIRPEFWSTYMDQGNRNAVVQNNVNMPQFTATTIPTNGTAYNAGIGSGFFTIANNDSGLDYLNDVPVPGVRADEAIAADAVAETNTLTPQQIYGELQKDPNPFTLLDVDKKLRLFQSMVELVRINTSGGVKASLQDAVQRLQARSKYKQLKRVRTFFDKFDSTNDDAINALLERHNHLRIGPADDFIPEMPVDAMEVMHDYAGEVVKLIGLKPCFFLIAKKDDFKTRENQIVKRDPILLVQSPFAYTWQILGVWGEEMSLLNEL